jgi:hypothetical protein
MIHLDTLNTSYWQKKGWESNWQFDSRPLKVKNHHNFFACKWCATYHWKALNESYKFALDLISIGGLHTCYGPSKLWESQLWEFRDSHLGVLGQNDIWVLIPWPSKENIVRGKVVASPKFGLWWVLWVRVCPWLVRTPKCYNYALTNLLFDFCVGLCEWLNYLSIFLIPSQNSNMPFYPRSVVSQRTRSNFFSFWCVHLWSS